MLDRESFPQRPDTASIGGLMETAGIEPAQDSRHLIRNCSLVLPSERTTSRIRLPLVRLPHEWHEDTLRRPKCVGVPGNRGKKYPPTPPVSADVIAILDELFDPVRDGRGKWATKWGVMKLRNRALIALLWRSGLRIHEGLLLKPMDIDFERCMVTVQRGKGGKRGISGIDPEGLAEVNSWLFIRAELGFGLDEFVFPVLEGPTRGGMLEQGYVRTVLHKARKDAGVPHRVTPHQLRHAMATEWARDGVAVPLISRQLRHSNIATTATYLASIAPEEVLAVASARSWSR